MRFTFGYHYYPQYEGESHQQQAEKQDNVRVNGIVNFKAACLHAADVNCIRSRLVPAYREINWPAASAFHSYALAGILLAVYI